MKKILLDSDVLLDFLRRKKPFFRSAAELFVLVKDKKISAYTSSLVIANIAYLLSKEIPKVRTKKVITRILDLLNVIELKENHLRLAASSDFSDFEDAVEYYCALEKKVDFIITRNKKDFKKSQIPVLDATEFIALIQS